MYRILLADDEGIMLNSLKHIIESNFGSECEITCVKTGRGVVEQAESFRPDISFVDIQMPGLNGIQAIKEIRQTNKTMVIVIISAFDKFGYAQEAVNLGVMEYLTKPVNKKTILDVCMRAMHQVDDIRKKRSDDLRIREKLEIVVPMIESGFIYNILQDDTEIYQESYEEMLNITDKFCSLLVLEFGDSEEKGVMTNAVGVSVKASRFYPQLREIIKDYFDCIVGSVMGNRVVAYIPVKRENFQYEERVEMITRTRNMIHKLENRIDSRFRAGIGTVRPMEEAKESYNEALTALRECEGHVVHFRDLPSYKEYEGEYPVNLENKYYQRGVKADKAGALRCAGEIYDWMVKNYGDCREDIEIKVLELVMQLEYRGFQKGGMKYGFRYRHNYMKEVREAAGFEELRRWFMGKTAKMCESMGSLREKESESLVFRVKNYIDENYQKELSLDEVSRMVDVSPYYLSRLFKQETGKTFIEYLTSVRMKEARRLLANPDYSIKEVCVMSGYGDPNYFSRIFKKYEGITPTEYREG
ncbi:helix-turn-helix domain-containing protein [Clostridium sp. AM58-1XD]|uniref:helix-turn-helix domain-containing protein n=1 Tax=Clostridium sp. AM58-1XD TaxID=2292307 RepID=UPI000E493A31|nr:helix-turn-helix domain-containing protein [Clostridium sp. AM58-1XD]RGY96454.1 helix-turn-helix domain-containing protein [Clostridium sp. AM58-1XD]